MSIHFEHKIKPQAIFYNDLVPGKNTPGVKDGSKGNPGKNGPSIYFTDYVPDNDYVKGILLDRISQNLTLSSDNSQKLNNVTYSDGDLIISETKRTYQLVKKDEEFDLKFLGKLINEYLDIESELYTEISNVDVSECEIKDASLPCPSNRGMDSSTNISTVKFYVNGDNVSVDDTDNFTYEIIASNTSGFVKKGAIYKTVGTGSVEKLISCQDYTLTDDGNILHFYGKKTPTLNGSDDPHLVCDDQSGSVPEITCRSSEVTKVPNKNIETATPYENAMNKSCGFIFLPILRINNESYIADKCDFYLKIYMMNHKSYQGNAYTCDNEDPYNWTPDGVYDPVSPEMNNIFNFYKYSEIKMFPIDVQADLTVCEGYNYSTLKSKIFLTFVINDASGTNNININEDYTDDGVKYRAVRINKNSITCIYYSETGINIDNIHPNTIFGKTYSEIIKEYVFEHISDMSCDKLHPSGNNISSNYIYGYVDKMFDDQKKHVACIGALNDSPNYEHTEYQTYREQVIIGDPGNQDYFYNIAHETQLKEDKDIFKYRGYYERLGIIQQSKMQIEPLDEKWLNYRGGDSAFFSGLTSHEYGDNCFSENIKNIMIELTKTSPDKSYSQYVNHVCLSNPHNNIDGNYNGARLKFDNDFVSSKMLDFYFGSNTYEIICANKSTGETYIIKGKMTL